VAADNYSHAAGLIAAPSFRYTARGRPERASAVAPRRCSRRRPRSAARFRRTEVALAPQPGDIAIEQNEVAVHRSLQGGSHRSAISGGRRLLRRAVVCLETLLDGWQVLAAASRFPLGNQRRQLCSHCHQAQGGFRAVEIVPDLLVHRLLDAHHVGPQNTHFAADFINSVVHDLLEQKENIESSYRCKQGDGMVTKYGKAAERIGAG
jgi:hypothetical protein